MSKDANLNFGPHDPDAFKTHCLGWELVKVTAVLDVYVVTSQSDQTAVDRIPSILQTVSEVEH